MSELAINGGTPVLPYFVPYSRPCLREQDVEAVVEVLRGQWLTTGPKIAELEEVFARKVGAKYAVALNSGTAALHLAYEVLGLGEGDEVMVPAITFAATAAGVVMAGAKPTLVDVGDDLNLDIEDATSRITGKTAAIAPVHIAGLPVEMDDVMPFANEHNLKVVQDAAHAVAAQYREQKLGAYPDAAAYSLHAVKPIVAAEGGMLTVNDKTQAELARKIRHHSISTSSSERHGAGASYFYEIDGLGFNYRMSDVHAALAISQMGRVKIDRDYRQQIANAYYDDLSEFTNDGLLETIETPDYITHGWHLFVIKLNLDRFIVGRDEIFAALRAENVGVNVHYIPLNFHPYYQKKFGWKPSDTPNAAALFERTISIPMHNFLTESERNGVIEALRKVLHYYEK